MNVASLRATLESDHFASAEAFVRAVRWEDVLGRAYSGRIELEIHVPDYDASLLLGSDISLVLARGSVASRRLSGVVSSVLEVRKLTAGVSLVLEVVPAFALLALRRRSRVFQDMSVPDIASEVLGSELGTYGRDFANELRGSYPVREYCVQYKESDLAFVSRLLEEEGIWFSFDHSGEVERMILRDENARADRVESATGGEVPYVTAAAADDAETESVFAARLCAELTPTAVATRHFDWTQVTNAEATDEESPASGPSAERYEQGHGSTLTLADFAGRYGAHDAVQRARVWREGLTSPRLRLRGTGLVIGFGPGTRFDLSGHPSPEANAEHLLVSVTHKVTSTEQADEGQVGLAYENEFDAQPIDRPFRPPRVTPRPAIPGVETAIVTGSGGEEIETDEHGRIKVQLHWDRDGASDEHSSCWLRCAQAWAGPGWGWLFLPRIGMEVVVRFEHGDPDRPLCTGALYKGSNPPPYSLPGEKTKSTIKSRSSIGGGGFNELRFEDLTGSEEVFQHAQRDLDEVVLNDHTTSVGAHQSNHVHNDQLQEIVNNQTETVATTQDLDVGGDRTVEVKGGFDETVATAETRLVSAGSTETIAGGETHTVTDAGLLELVTGKETRTVSGGLTETLHDSHVQIVTGAVTETVSASMLRKGSSISHTASASLTMTGTAGIDMNGNCSIDVTSPDFKRLTSRSTTTAATSSDSDATKVDIFPSVLDVALFKNDSCGVAVDIVKDKTDIAGLSAGAYGATFALTGGKLGLVVGGKFDFTLLHLIAKGIRKLTS